MKAMILAAGRGERLRPLTDTLPKPLVAVAGKPLIEYHIERLAAAGFSDIVINCAWLADILQQRLGDGSRFGVTLHFSVEREALETGGGIKQALPLLGNEPFLVINGDIFIERLPTLPLQLAADSLAHLWLVPNPEHHPEGDFALQAGKVSNAGSDKFTFSGIGIYHPALFADCPQSRFALGPVLRDAMTQGRVSGEIFTPYWCDVGTIERLAQAEAFVTHHSISQ
ncbi:nucleotidyltransferase family protein [Shewanella sp. C32]|uniref:Nucleotidyltransferase family protein n=1 Tax=Shewanella electrica TaxID=515560 RepID=A0ABT2FIP1_9GAMM|nr:nucleotidyltransferase family protein [Shewanella electrica]MCH1924289.1 nucleotidyltransferase family protein [Shewanella electrica]MCS4556192.1 nucleotidyltransferase family protein [Shewanella electrica]